MTGLELKKKRKSLHITQSELAEKLGVTVRTIVNWEGGSLIPESKKLLLDLILNDDGKQEDRIHDLHVTDAQEFDYTENSNSNGFIRLPNNQYLMTMPLADFKIQAGLLDRYQDEEYIKEVSKHVISVEKPVKGRYIAFRVNGDSMDDGSNNAISKGSIVSTRELQRHLWTSKLRYKDYPYWVIYTTQSKMPLLKEIIDHDVENGVITCHSLNDSPEFSDFKLHLDDVQALFNVISIEKNISDINEN